MTAVCHHPHGETLMSHAAGTLDPPLSVVLRCHFWFCERCRARLCALDNVCGAFLEGLRRRKTRSFSHGRKYRFAGYLPKEQAVCCLP
jgi:anti-sigma factor ChrR (cupin superfamily)